MPWADTNPMNERVKFIAACLARKDGDETFAELCDRFGISAKSGYKWLNRYEEGGVANLVEKSRAPHCHPNAISGDAVEALLAARRRHARWGPRKLLVVVARQHPDLELPVASTVGALLKRHGLVGKPKRTRRSSPYGDRLRNYDAPNSVWCADFKGNFPVAGERCSPLTVTDGFSRYLLRCQALRHTLYAPVRRIFESAFEEFGLPDAIRTDNGPPFSTLAPGGLSRLAIWWIHLGIRPERILPGRPDQNGRHERMHLTLKAECCRPPRSSFRSQQRAFDAFQQEYNVLRPHEALSQQTPTSLYQRSIRRLPRHLPELEYPTHFQLARTYPNGVISFASTQWYLSGCLKNEVVGLEEVDDDRWRVHFGPVVLGILDARNAKERGSRQFGLLVRTDGKVTGKRRRRRRRSYRR
jgi:transposase InsO family protein